ncbi:MAG TPA: hypothetical protein VG456_28480 [Candidatus Sulfopaludibacter sp.]|nr:hypothetical protein [Candidatus Sulfopaludibacter sp.]
MKKSLILTGAVAFFSLLASAKTYDITLSSPTLAGNVQLKAGQYHMKVAGNNVTFTELQSDKAVTVPVTVKQAPQKFDFTAVDTDKKTGTDKIQTIELGGSNTQLEFGE